MIWDYPEEPEQVESWEPDEDAAYQEMQDWKMEHEAEMHAISMQALFVAAATPSPVGKEARA